MNVLYCGDSGIEKGLLLSVLSLIRTVNEPLQIYVMTAHFCHGGREYQPVSGECLEKLRTLLKRADSASDVYLIDASDEFLSELPAANMDTRFTPCCMLRLYADRIDGLPDRILLTMMFCAGRTLGSSIARICRTLRSPASLIITAVGSFAERTAGKTTLIPAFCSLIYQKSERPDFSETA